MSDRRRAVVAIGNVVEKAAIAHRASNRTPDLLFRFNILAALWFVEEVSKNVRHPGKPLVSQTG